MSQKSVSKETYYSVKRDLLQCQKRPTTVSKETYYSVKRDLLQCQKGPTTVSKETYYSVKRDLLQCQKRPTTVSKRTYYSVNRRCTPGSTLALLPPRSSLQPPLSPRQSWTRAWPIAHARLASPQGRRALPWSLPARLIYIYIYIHIYIYIYISGQVAYDGSAIARAHVKV